MNVRTFHIYKWYPKEPSQHVRHGHPREQRAQVEVPLHELHNPLRQVEGGGSDWHEDRGILIFAENLSFNRMYESELEILDYVLSLPMILKSPCLYTAVPCF